MAEAASRSQLTFAKGALSEPYAQQQIIEKAAERGVSINPQRLEELSSGITELVGDLNELVSTVREQKPDATTVKTVVIPGVISEHADQLKTIAGLLDDMDNGGIATALESLSDMTKAGGLQVSVLGSGPAASDQDDKTGDRIHIIRPKVVISDRITRLVVLDANYEASLLAQMDPTVRLATGAEVFGRALQPKVYDHLSIRWYADASGRRHGENQGLDNRRIRRRIITEQAQRAALVPPDERCLFVTFRKRATGPDFTAEIVDALNTYCPSWSQQVVTPDGELKPRIEILTWGAHEGLNEFSDVGHVFVIGVMRRGWVTKDAKASLRSDVFARRRGDQQSIKEVDPNVLITNQVAGALIQALGRGRMRQTINGQAGQMVAHIP
ncbi:MAG: hypothetical protein FJ077_12725 [Cyanobacteria bacterium K_DeepCast_35m_m2_023]|nr:hypothetical protein [Cyanobacteria bacterium K_DeepCast_35m_m2_023]